jgi:hypothetical protein
VTISCKQHPSGAKPTSPRPGKAAEQLEHLEPTWEEAVTASAKMQKELDAIFREYVFKPDKRIGDFSEGFGSVAYYSSTTVGPDDVEAIVARVRRVAYYSPPATETVGWTYRDMQLPAVRNPDGNDDLIIRVGIKLDDSAEFNLGSGPVAILTVGRELTDPAWTFSFIDPHRVSETATGKDGYWIVFSTAKQGKEELAGKARAELIERGYVEGANGPWITFTRGRVMVAVCNAPEYETVGTEGSQRVVPKVDDDAANSRHEWPVVILRVEGLPR